jgi:hypothetical protein
VRRPAAHRAEKGSSRRVFGYFGASACHCVNRISENSQWKVVWLPGQAAEKGCLAIPAGRGSQATLELLACLTRPWAGPSLGTLRFESERVTEPRVSAGANEQAYFRNLPDRIRTRRPLVYAARKPLRHRSQGVAARYQEISAGTRAAALRAIECRTDALPPPLRERRLWDWFRGAAVPGQPARFFVRLEAASHFGDARFTTPKRIFQTASVRCATPRFLFSYRRRFCAHDRGPPSEVTSPLTSIRSTVYQRTRQRPPSVRTFQMIPL